MTASCATGRNCFWPPFQTVLPTWLFHIISCYFILFWFLCALWLPGLHLGLQDGHGTPLPSMLSSQIFNAMPRLCWLFFRSERLTLGRLGRLGRCPQTVVLLRVDEAYATLDSPRIPWRLSLTSPSWAPIWTNMNQCFWSPLFPSKQVRKEESADPSRCRGAWDFHQVSPKLLARTRGQSVTVSSPQGTLEMFGVQNQTTWCDHIVFPTLLLRACTGIGHAQKYNTSFEIVQTLIESLTRGGHWCSEGGS